LAALLALLAALLAKNLLLAAYLLALILFNLATLLYDFPLATFLVFLTILAANLLFDNLTALKVFLCLTGLPAAFLAALRARLAADLLALDALIAEYLAFLWAFLALRAARLAALFYLKLLCPTFLLSTNLLGAFLPDL